MIDLITKPYYRNLQLYCPIIKTQITQSINKQLVPRAGKHKTGAKRGKTYNRCQAREIMQSVPSAGKHETGAKRGKRVPHTEHGKCPYKTKPSLVCS